MEKRRKCPLLKLTECDPGCILFRSGVRFYDSGPKVGQKEPFEECGIVIGVDSLENLVERSIGQQRATEENRNEINRLLQFFQGMAASKALENKN